LRGYCLIGGVTFGCVMLPLVVAAIPPMTIAGISLSVSLTQGKRDKAK